MRSDKDKLQTAIELLQYVVTGEEPIEKTVENIFEFLKECAKDSIDNLKKYLEEHPELKP